MEELNRAAFLAKSEWKGSLELVLEKEKTNLELTHLDKVFWQEEGYTKGDLLKYYLEVAPYMLPHLMDRPAFLKRYPNGYRPGSSLSSPNGPNRGIDFRNKDGGFFQQNFEPKSPPPFLQTVRLPNDRNQPVNYAVYNGLATLLYLTNLGTIAHNPWHSRLSDLDHPDYIAIDLDPHGAPFENVLEVALAVRKALEHAGGLLSYVKTSGSTGLHLFVPLHRGRYDYAQAASFAEELTGRVAKQYPKIATLERRVDKRLPGQIYLDWQQNARGKAIAAVYSVRAKPGATVSMPLSWEEVEKGDFSMRDFTIKTAPARLRKLGDLWQDLAKHKQSLPQQ
ncbi:MAG TPA: hypothetical protein VH186_28270 [Chloroflexia bacterium]|nr:hypothetical protein [Chloroflexia bacterium]